ncbi:MAG: TonB-dependent siderophore receptor [Hyphomicrobiales bacterium]|nr:TonB-dependent siderophore receptor [Hyphomicrobiales bacterium]
MTTVLLIGTNSAYGGGSAFAQETNVAQLQVSQGTSDGVELPTIDVKGGRPDGQAGYITRRVSTATKTDTKLLDVPQSVTVITEEQIKDQAFPSLTEALRFSPGVIPHQGEFNRDQVIIRGQSSSADFYVNGIRDDVQYFRDLYNTQRIEVLKGPNAMIFGRGGGGGVINRVLKEADGTTLREIDVQAGSYGQKRTAVDIGQAINENVAVRLNSFIEDSATYRDFVKIKRYGFNPTVTFTPSASTSIKLSYEYFHDDRTTDRGIPSQFGRPYITDTSTFFGNPNLNNAHVDANIATATVEHETEFGVKIRNQSRFAYYDRAYQNVFPGGAVNSAGTSVNLSAYNNATKRTNLFNQTDLTYKLDTGFMRHTLLAGAEFGRQVSDNYRMTGLFNGVSSSLAVNPLFPISFVPVTFLNNGTTDANARSIATVAAGYVQDQVEITKYFQLIGGVRFDHVNLDYTNHQVGGLQLTHTDNLVSPRGGIVVKPREDVSLYASYSVSYLPASGDQFGALAPNTVFLKPEKFTNKEVGVKWDVRDDLQLTVALYQLDRENTRINDPANPGFFLLSGQSRAKGVELGINGYVTDKWQISGGYAYTDAKITSATSAAPVGNRLQLVPYNTFTLWNRYNINEQFGVGAAVIHQTNSFTAVDNTVRLPGFTRVDGALFFKINKTFRAQLNVENILNAKYYSTADGNNNITPGSPRAVRVGLTATF